LEIRKRLSFVRALMVDDPSEYRYSGYEEAVAVFTFIQLEGRAKRHALGGQV